MKLKPEELKLKIAKLPAWAQEHIESLTRERDVALRDQREYLDTQTESPFYVPFEGSGSSGKRRSTTRKSR